MGGKPGLQEMQSIQRLEICRHILGTSAACFVVRAGVADADTLEDSRAVAPQDRKTNFALICI